MTAAFAPIPLQGLPLGRMSPQAILALAPEALAGRLGLRFQDGQDDLDLYVAAGIRAAGEDAVLMAHRGNPGRRAQVYLLDAPGYIEGVAGTAEDARRRVDAVLAALGIEGADVDWRRGEPDPVLA